MERKIIEAQIRLLDDPDEEVYDLIRESLISIGSEIIPELESVWESTLDQKFQERIETLIKVIQFNSLKKDFSKWVDMGGIDMGYGAFLLARHQYPDLKWETIDKQFESLRKEIWIELNQNLTALEKVRVINHILFENHKFTSNNANFYSPQNSLVNIVLESKKGNPVTLGIIYLVLAARLDLPIYGVNLPKNFILAYQDQISAFHAFGDTENSSVLFYINPFNRGAVFGRKEIDYFLKQQQLEPRMSYYTPCSNVAIAGRLISTLLVSYEKLGYKDKIDELNELNQIIADSGKNIADD